MSDLEYNSIQYPVKYRHPAVSDKILQDIYRIALEPCNLFLCVEELWNRDTSWAC